MNAKSELDTKNNNYPELLNWIQKLRFAIIAIIAIIAINHHYRQTSLTIEFSNEFDF